jgi:hypothetical protein
MYMQEPVETEVIERAAWAELGVIVPAVLTVVFGVLPGILFGFLKSASVVRF